MLYWQTPSPSHPHTAASTLAFSIQKKFWLWICHCSYSSPRYKGHRNEIMWELGTKWSLRCKCMWKIVSSCVWWFTNATCHISTPRIVPTLVWCCIFQVESPEAFLLLCCITLVGEKLQPLIMLPLQTTLFSLTKKSPLFLRGCGVWNADGTEVPVSVICFYGSLWRGEFPWLWLR